MLFHELFGTSDIFFLYLNNISSDLCILTYELEPFLFQNCLQYKYPKATRHYKEFDPMLFHRLCGIWRKSFIIKSYVEVESYFIWASRPDLWIMIDDWAFVENLLCSHAGDFLNIFVRDVLTHPIVIYHIRWFYFYLTFLSSGTSHCLDLDLNDQKTRHSFWW